MDEREGTEKIETQREVRTMVLKRKQCAVMCSNHQFLFCSTTQLLILFNQQRGCAQSKQEIHV